MIEEIATSPSAPRNDILFKMNETNLGLTPLILLPGVALLSLSTSVRLYSLHDEVRELLDHHCEAD